MIKRNNPIGVFDSGVGGLTVAAAIKYVLPAENIIYLGDLLHLPYGSKSSKAVLELTTGAVQYLVDRGVKLIVLACNTATSIARDTIEKEVTVPVVGVIEPGAYSACKITMSKRIGVIGTKRTIESNAYYETIMKFDSDITVFQKATPLLVPLIEEGWQSHPVLQLVLSEYLSYFSKKSIDTLLLGCTHYPLIKSEIGGVMNKVKIVDSAQTTAEAIAHILNENDECNDTEEFGEFQIHLTDYTDAFKVMGERILGRALHDFKIITPNWSEGKIVYD